MCLRGEGCHHGRTSKYGHSGTSAKQSLGKMVPTPNLSVKVSLCMPHRLDLKSFLYEWERQGQPRISSSRHTHTVPQSTSCLNKGRLRSLNGHCSLPHVIIAIFLPTKYLW